MIIDSSQVFFSSARSFSKGASASVKTTETYKGALENVKSKEYCISEKNDVMEDDTKSVFRSLLNLILMMKKEHERHFFGTTEGQNEFLNNSIDLSTGMQPMVMTRTCDIAYTYFENETTTFSSTGQAVTADGRTIEFGLEMSMSRSFTEAIGLSHFQQVETVFMDPLVINLKDSPATVSDKKFYFDIDCDGKKDELSSLGGNSGFLVYDRNNDGIINDGSEMFGTKSGNGFNDLAAFDEDGNGYIDEADSIFNKLKVWVQDEKGNRQISLKDADVGAIYLGYAKSDFSLNDELTNETMAKVRNSGIFLRESGGAGTVQQIDFAKQMMA